MADLAEVSHLAGAQAKLVIFIASLLQRADVARMDEFAALLSVFAETVSETEPDEARILDQWAAGVRAFTAN